MKIWQKNNGITIVSLVITIIILLILAVIALPALTGSELFQGSINAEEQTKLTQIEEQMKLTMTEMITEKNGEKVTVDDYIDHITEEDKINITDRYDEDGKQIIVVDDKYVYEIVDNNPYVTVDKVGIKDKLPPIIKLESITGNTNSITVTVSTKRNEGGKIEYYIKQDTEEKYTLKETTTDMSYTFTELEQNKKYNIKIVAIAENGQKAEVLVDRTLGSIPDLKPGDVTFIYSIDGHTINKETWTNKNVTVTVRTEIIGYTLKTSKDGITWDDTKEQNFTENGQIYVVLYDGTNYGGSATGNVTNIDTTKPVVTGVTATTNSITITATDEASGIVGYAVTTSNTAPADSSYTAVTSTKTFETTVAGKTQGTTYYVWVKDAAGNVSESKTTGTEKVPGLIDADITFTYSPAQGTWTNGSVTVTATANKDITGYTLKLSTDLNTWTDSVTRTENGPVYAKLSDNTNQYGEQYASGNVTNIDTTKPVVTGATATTNSITITATDEASGIVGYAVTASSTAPADSSYTAVTSTKTFETTVTGKTQGTTYYIWVKDAAGNVSESKTTGTEKVPGLIDADITFTYSPAQGTWTNGSVTVTVTANKDITGYTLKLSTDLNTWTDSVTRTENGPVYAKLSDNTNQYGEQYASGNVTNIDTTKPVVTGATATTNSITITATDEASGIVGYAVTTSSTAPADSSYTAVASTKTFETTVTGKTQGTTYYVWVKDAAGNVSTSKETVTILANGSWNSSKQVNTPQLMEGMTGIYWDENGNEITVIGENQDNWYDYNNKKWANAITKDSNGNTTGYWVWIPRYAYQITNNCNTSTAGTIVVKFLQGTTNKDASGTERSKTYPTVTNNAMTDYVVHPCFTNGNKTAAEIANGTIPFGNGEWDAEIPGFWVAKYPAGFQANTITDNNGTLSTTISNASDTVVYSNKNYTSYHDTYTSNALGQILSSSGYSSQKISYPVFKPLTYAYNNISTGDSYTISQEIKNATNFYGLSSTITDSHMMKNSEWGALAYLTQSSFGRNGEEINLNNYYTTSEGSYRAAVTGMCINGTSGDKTTTLGNAYNTTIGVKGSSTSNITGVYDLHGCVWERTSAYISSGNASLGTYGSSFASTIANINGYKTLSTKYATVYPYNSSNTKANNYNTYKGLKSNIYGFGDAMLEISSTGANSTSWNGDYSYFPSGNNTFFKLGGNYGGSSNAGVFAFHSTTGAIDYSNGFRAVLIGI